VNRKKKRGYGKTKKGLVQLKGACKQWGAASSLGKGGEPAAQDTEERLGVAGGKNSAVKGLRPVEEGSRGSARWKEAGRERKKKSEAGAESKEVWAIVSGKVPLEGERVDIGAGGRCGGKPRRKTAMWGQGELGRGVEIGGGQRGRSQKSGGNRGRGT